MSTRNFDGRDIDADIRSDLTSEKVTQLDCFTQLVGAGGFRSGAEAVRMNVALEFLDRVEI